MQLEQLATKLESLGLSDKEARVYVSNLLLGPAPVQKIAEQASINRATTYVILDQLAQLGFVSQSTEGKKTAYVAENPESLNRLFDQRQAAIQRQREELIAILPDLKKISRTPQTQAPSVRFYRGLEGIKTINAYLRRKSKPKTVIYGLSNVNEIVRIFPDILKDNPDFRTKKKLASKLFYSWSDKELPSNAKLIRQTKKLGKAVPADITLYEDSASLLTYAGKDSIGIIIESPEIVAALRQLFEMAWQSKPK